MQHTITVQEPVNERPVAVITGPTTVQPGVDVRLDGLLSSDADGDALTYVWSIVNSPSGSSPFIGETSLGTVFFSADIEGDYSIQLAVSDQYSTDSTIHVVSVGSGTVDIPVADAGNDVNVIAGVEIILDGTGSTSAENTVLTYSWSVVDSPQGSQWSLDDTETSNPIFSSSESGVYTVLLVVNDGQRESVPDQIVITVDAIQASNKKPVAVAGDNTSGETGVEINLIGSASTDADGDTLSFQWRIASQPPNSLATITGSDSVTASLIPDIQGEYVIELVVSDGVEFSVPDTLVVDIVESGSGNSPPIPSAGYDQSLIVGTEVWLRGGLSFDPDPGDVLELSWSLESKPIGSAATIDIYNSGETTVTLDEPGNYIVTLSVSDGIATATDSIVISAVVATVDLPDDPGPFSGDSVFGFDDNQNGVRDDVERFISANYREDSNLQNALFQLAASIRTVFIYSGTDALIGDALTVVNNAYECYYSVSDDQNSLTSAEIVSAEMINSDARMNAFFEFGSTVEGYVHIGNPIDDWADSCNFDVQP